MEKASQRIKVIAHDLAKIEAARKDDSDSDDDDLDDREGLKAEMQELEKQNKVRHDKLEEYEKNRKWNVDNMCKVTAERTIINPDAKTSFTPDGFVQPKDVEPPVKPKSPPSEKKQESKKTQETEVKKTNVFEATKKMEKTAIVAPEPPKVVPGAMETYPEFTDKYAETVEIFMQITDLEGSKEFLLKYGDILLQENASNYLLLASLEDEMNGHHEKMKQTARQAQIITHIAELAKTMQAHPGNVIMPFFQRLQQREHLEEFLAAVKLFVDRIVTRAIVKKKEIDEAREKEEPTDLADIPLEERLGPGGLDPVEVIKTLPDSMVQAFESRDVQQLQDALTQMDPADAERHMKNCVDSGLWTANS
jgi:cell division cycle protein 37